MVRKFLVLVFLAFSSVVFLPSEARAEKVGDKSVTVGEYNANPLFQRGRNRRRNSRWYNSRGNRSWNRNRNRVRRFRLVRQTFYRNGRRYTRTVRVYY